MLVGLAALALGCDPVVKLCEACDATVARLAHAIHALVIAHPSRLPLEVLDDRSVVFDSRAPRLQVVVVVLHVETIEHHSARRRNHLLSQRLLPGVYIFPNPVIPDDSERAHGGCHLEIPVKQE